jgi:Ca2+-binding RTX toxin-like protein
MSYTIDLVASDLDPVLDSYNVSADDKFINYLLNVDNLTNPIPTEVVNDPGNPIAVGGGFPYSIPLDPTAELLLVSSNDVAVYTDNSALKGIVDTSQTGSNLFIRGGANSANVVVAATDGNDAIYLQDGGNDVVYLGSGPDESSKLTMGSGVIDARGSTGNDSLFAGSGNSDLWAGAGHDTLFGGTGVDFLSAGPGSGSGELISGSSSLVAGSFNILGDDSSTNHTLQGSSGADGLYNTGSGNDQLLSGSVAGGPVNLLNGTPFSGTLIDDRGSGNDFLQGGAGNDILYERGTGHDTLQGGTGGNSLNALAGSGSGELLSGSLAGGFNVLGDASGNDHTLMGAAGADSLYAAGAGNDLLIGGTGAQLLDAQNSFGNDSLQANGSESNTLYAGSGDDTLDGSGNSGNSDFFSHAFANSTMMGGSGDDAFQVSNVDPLGGPGTNPTTVDITLGSTSAQDWVGFQDREFSDGTLTSATAAGVTTYTMTFNDGQTVDISGTQGSGTNVQLIFDDQTIDKTF